MSKVVTAWRRVRLYRGINGVVSTDRGASQLETFCGGKVCFDLEEVV